MSIKIVDSAGNVFEPAGDFTVKVANADVGDFEQLRDHATTIVGLVTALTLMYSWFRKPMKQLIAREQQQEEDLAILTWAFCRMRMTTIRGRAGVLRRKRAGAEYAQKLRGERTQSPVRKLRTGHSCSAGNAAREAKQMTKQKAYVQFSKQIVLLVTIAVTAISLLAVVLCFSEATRTR